MLTFVLKSYLISLVSAADPNPKPNPLDAKPFKMAFVNDIHVMDTEKIPHRAEN